jgi:signal transduction histidine kinase
MEKNGRIRILNVDDNDANRYILTRIFIKAGYDICEAANGKDALSLVESEQPNLVILDVNLPDISGYEVCQRLKSNPITKSIPILGISSYYTKDQDWIYGLECGADNYLIKPIDNHVLLAIVKSMLRVQSTESKLRVALKEAETVNYMKTQFLANISHELRTPINVILAALQVSNVIIDDIALLDLKEKLMKYNGMMKQNSYRLIRLINNLIDITKVDSGFMKLSLHNLNIVKIVEDITLSVVSFVESKGIELIFDTDVEEKFTACDPNKIERIIFNLLSNAIKFTEVGGKISVSLFDKDDNIIISVKDTGIGISKENQKKIFQRFLQVDDSLSRNTEGSGIGLSLVKSFVEMHGGEITVKSCFGKGSNFMIKLPIKTLESPEETNVENLNINSNNTDIIHVEFSDIYV